MRPPISLVKYYTVEPAHAVTWIKKAPYSCPVIENFIWIEPLLRGHLSYKATFSLFKSWPLNTGLTVLPPSQTLNSEVIKIFKTHDKILWEKKMLNFLQWNFQWNKPDSRKMSRTENEINSSTCKERSVTTDNVWQIREEGQIVTTTSKQATESGSIDQFSQGVSFYWLSIASLVNELYLRGAVVAVIVW